MNSALLLIAVRYYGYAQRQLEALERAVVRRFAWYKARRAALREHRTARFCLITLLVWEGAGQWMLLALVAKLGL